MIPVVTAQEIRDMDRVTIEEIGLPGSLLMEHAGRQVAEAVVALEPERVAVLCGSGANGGDGFVCARWLHEWGYEVTTFLARGRPEADTDAGLHLGVLEAAGAIVESMSEAPAGVLGEFDLVVDALLGTGLDRDVEGDLRQLIRRMNELDVVRVAVDVPSGLHADTGRVMGVAIEADVTVTFAFPKVGLVTHPGMQRAGQLQIADIGIPDRLADHVRLGVLEQQDAAELLPPRETGGHKGTFGHVLCVAGSQGKVGAGLLAARGALRSGAGLVTLAVAADAQPRAEGRVAEIMCVALDFDCAREDRSKLMASLTGGKDAIVWGPGVPTTPAAGMLLEFALPRMEVPCVLDAEALNHFAGSAERIAQSKTPCVLTPHPGEAARLLECDTKEVSLDRLGAARRLADMTRSVVVLKGAHTIVAEPGGRAVINPTGNAGMATGGTGDVLSGVIGALLAQGLDPYPAAQLGEYVHGLAGDIGAEKRGTMSLTAGDVLGCLPRAFVRLERA